MLIISSDKPQIHNVVCTSNLEQKINIIKLSKLHCGIYDEMIYGGRCGYIKTPEMDGRVTIFPSGKIISVGGKSIKKAIEQLNHAKFYLLQEKMIKDIKLIPKIQNIVATVKLNRKLQLKKLSSKIAGSTYNPKKFSGLVIKSMNGCSFLIFSSGKIIIVGSKSYAELNRGYFNIVKILHNF